MRKVFGCVCAQAHNQTHTLFILQTAEILFSACFGLLRSKRLYTRTHLPASLGLQFLVLLVANMTDRGTNTHTHSLHLVFFFLFLQWPTRIGWRWRWWQWNSLLGALLPLSLSSGAEQGANFRPVRVNAGCLTTKAIAAAVTCTGGLRTQGLTTN